MDHTGDERSSWPAAAVCRLLPAALVGAALAVVLSRWSVLPPHRPGPLVIPMITGGIATLAVIPDMLHPKGWSPARFEGPAYVVGLYGIVLGWLKAHFGPVAAKLFVIAASSGILIDFVVASSGSTTWKLAWPGALGSPFGAALVATLGGMVVRARGRLVDSRALPPSRLPSPQPDYSTNEV